MAKLMLSEVSLAMMIISLVIQTACGLSQNRTAGVAAPAASATVSPSPPAKLTTKDRPARPLDHSIRKVDFLNFTYDWFPRWDSNPEKPSKVTLKRGKMGVSHPDDHSGIGEIEFSGLSYGDVTGDGVEDAVVALFINTTGTQRPFCILAYTVEGKSPKLLWLHETGGGGGHGLRDYYVEDGQVVIEEYDPIMGLLNGKEVQMTNGAANRYTRVYYSWDGNDFNPVRSEQLPNKTGTVYYVGDHKHNEVGEEPIP